MCLLTSSFSQLLIQSFACAITYSFTHISTCPWKFFVTHSTTCQLAFSSISYQSFTYRKHSYVICMLAQSLSGSLFCIFGELLYWQVGKECRVLTSGMLGMWQLDSLNFPPASAARLCMTMKPNMVAYSWQGEAAHPEHKLNKVSHPPHLSAHMYIAENDTVSLCLWVSFICTIYLYRLWLKWRGLAADSGLCRD